MGQTLSYKGKQHEAGVFAENHIHSLGKLGP